MVFLINLQYHLGYWSDELNLSPQLILGNSFWHYLSWLLLFVNFFALFFLIAKVIRDLAKK